MCVRIVTSHIDCTVVSRDLFTHFTLVPIAHMFHLDSCLTSGIPLATPPLPSGRGCTASCTCQKHSGCSCFSLFVYWKGSKKSIKIPNSIVQWISSMSIRSPFILPRRAAPSPPIVAPTSVATPLGAPGCTNASVPAQAFPSRAIRKIWEYLL